MGLLTLSRTMGSATGTAEGTVGERPQWTASELHRAFLDDVYRFVHRRISRTEDAEDITAEVFAAAFRSLHKFRHESGERAWLFGIAQRKIADHLRRTGRRPESLWCETPVDAIAGSGEPAPPAAAERREAAAELRRILGVMPPDQRDALILQYADGLSIAEIAALMGRSVAAVNSLLQRARATIYREGQAYFAEPA